MRRAEVAANYSRQQQHQQQLQQQQQQQHQQQHESEAGGAESAEEGQLLLQQSLDQQVSTVTVRIGCMSSNMCFNSKLTRVKQFKSVI